MSFFVTPRHASVCYERLVLDLGFLYPIHMAKNIIISGHRVIASRKTDKGDTVILAVGDVNSYEPYVTARVEDVETATEWYWGYYFTKLESAIVSFKARCEIDQHVAI